MNMAHSTAENPIYKKHASGGLCHFKRCHKIFHCHSSILRILVWKILKRIISETDLDFAINFLRINSAVGVRCLLGCSFDSVLKSHILNPTFTSNPIYQISTAEFESICMILNPRSVKVSFEAPFHFWPNLLYFDCLADP